MKLAETILLALSVVFLVIGLHQSWMNGFASSYWIFMLMMLFYGLFHYKRIGTENREKKRPVKNGKVPTKRK